MEHAEFARDQNYSCTLLPLSEYCSVCSEQLVLGGSTAAVRASAQPGGTDSPQKQPHPRVTSGSRRRSEKKGGTVVVRVLPTAARRSAAPPPPPKVWPSRGSVTTQNPTKKRGVMTRKRNQALKKCARPLSDLYPRAARSSSTREARRPAAIPGLPGRSAALVARRSPPPRQVGAHTPAATPHTVRARTSG